MYLILCQQKKLEHHHIGEPATVRKILESLKVL
jgi:hypothetical protein